MQRGQGFKFEEAWLLWEDCEEVVQNPWDATVNDGHRLEIIKQKYRFVGRI